MSYDYVKDNYRALREEIASIADRVGVPTPTLVVVTKSGTDEELVALAAAGVTDIGENRPQELIRRGALLADAGYFPRLHEIGHLQTNKAAKVARIATLIHSVGSLSLAEELSRIGGREGRKIPILVEVNSACEAAKSGVCPEEIDPFVERVLALPHLSLCGLMTMGPNVEPEEIRPYFRLTKSIFDRVRTCYGYDTDAPVLSMGMSDSLRVAIEEGSTLVRVGRRLFIK